MKQILMNYLCLLYWVVFASFYEDIAWGFPVYWQFLSFGYLLVLAIAMVYLIRQKNFLVRCHQCLCFLDPRQHPVPLVRACADAHRCLPCIFIAHCHGFGADSKIPKQTAVSKYLL